MIDPRQGCSVSIWCESEKAEDEEHAEKSTETVEVERSATDSKTHEKPAAEDSYHVDALFAEGEVERV